MNFSKLNGLIPAVIQDERTNEVLMVGFMNEDALTRTRKSGYVTFFSRTRNTLWMKGESSGNKLKVLSLSTDCDEDTILIRVRREGAGLVCHLGTVSCFEEARPLARSVLGDARSTSRGVDQGEPDAFGKAC